MSSADQCENLGQLKMLMNAPAPGFEVETSSDGLVVSEYYAWDFSNIDKTMLNPIVFRAAPAVSAAADCKAWAEFAVTFVSTAVNVDRIVLNSFGRDCDGLLQFLKTRNMEGCSFEGSWKHLFAGHTDDDLDIINPDTQPELAWDVMCEAAEVQRRHSMPYEVLNVRKKTEKRSNRVGK